MKIWLEEKNVKYINNLNILGFRILKLISPFKNVAARIFNIVYVAFTKFLSLVDSAALQNGFLILSSRTLFKIFFLIPVYSWY